MPSLLVGQLVALAVSAAAQCPLTPGCPDDPVCTVQAITSGGVATLIPPDTCVVGHAELITIGERVVGITCDKTGFVPPPLIPSKASIGHGFVFCALGEAFPDCDLSTVDAYWIANADSTYNLPDNWSSHLVPTNHNGTQWYVHITPSHPPGNDPNPVVTLNLSPPMSRLEIGPNSTLQMTDASGSSTTVDFDPRGTITSPDNASNAGTIKLEMNAVAGRDLEFDGMNLDNAGGLIHATGTVPCTLTLIRSRITGGTLQVDGAAALTMYDSEISGSNLLGGGTNGLRAINNGSGISTLQNAAGNTPITNATTVFVESGAELVTNANGVTLQSSANTLFPEGRVQLLNEVTSTLGNAQGVIVNGASGGRQHSIDGAGWIVGRLINRSLIDARALDATHNTLTIDVPTSRDGAESPNGAEVVNYGTLRASNGAILDLHGAIENVRSLPNDVGMVAATLGGVVDIQADFSGNGAFQSNLGTIFGGPGSIGGDCVEILPNAGSAFSLAQFDGTNLRMNDLFLRGGTARFQGAARARFDTAIQIGDQSPGALLDILDGAQVDSHGTFTQISGATHIHDGAALRLITDVVPPTQPAPLTGVFQGGELRGAGRIVGNVNNTGATIRPGDSSGTLAIEAVSFGGPGGDFTQGSGGTLEIEINGPSAGGQFDQLLIDGAATLAGGLVLAINYSPPAVADEWTILRANSITGQFSANIPANFHLCYLDDRVLLKYLVHCPCTGDITGDGQADLSDLTTLLSQFGTIGTGLSADLDEDGDVDIGDLTMMLSSFGTTCP